MQSFLKWRRSRAGQLAGAAAEVALAYGFGSLAIDKGNLFFYALALVSAGAAIVSVTNAIKFNGKQ